MANDEVQITEAVRDNSVMSSAAANLASRVYLLEFVTKAPKFMWSDKLVGRGLLAREYCSVFRDLDINGECFESVSS